MVPRIAMGFQFMSERVASLRLDRGRPLPPAMLGKALLLAGLGLFTFPHHGFALGQVQYVENVSHPGGFPMVQENVPAAIYVDTNDYAGVVRAAGDLQADVARVTGCPATITHADSGWGT